MIETVARAFVAGASGLTGRAVVAALRRRDIETLAHVRPDSGDLDGWRERFGALGAELDTTAWDEEAMSAHLRERAPTMVFALLGTTRARAKKATSEGRDAAAETYEVVDYGLTALLRRAAAASGARPRFVYLSAMGASERSTNPYIVVRARIERELRDGELPYTVVRPSWIVGERDTKRPGESVGAALTDAALAVVGMFGAERLRDRYRSIEAEDLGEALVRLALDPGAENRIVEADELR
jgi:uncharacterized protein YbjT (DUF2867 family)